MSVDLFPGFRALPVPTRDGDIFVRVGGSGPPLLLLHGYPETHAMWHRVAPELAKQFTVIAADLRGYGRSFVAPTVSDHASYSKRAMAADAIAVMTQLGFDRFAVMGHDRGARVTYRMALEHPACVTRAAVLDIIPTLDVWETLTRSHAMRMWHWTFLAQAAPFPEHLIDADPRDYLEGRFRRGGASLPDWLDRHVLEDYWTAFRDPDRLHATCEDYRAGATIDVTHDAADVAAGRTIGCPLFAMWGAHGNLQEQSDPLALWRRWCPHVEGRAVDSGHFIPEERPEAVIELARVWLAA